MSQLTPEDEQQYLDQVKALADIAVDTPEHSRAMNYVTTVRNRFAQQPDVYSQFMRILPSRNKEHNVDEVIEEIKKLFVDHSDLLMDFLQFLPEDVQEKARERFERSINGVPDRTIEEANAEPTTSTVMEETESVCERIHVSSHPVIAHKVNRLRDANTKPSDYRRLIKEVSFQIVCDATANDTDLLDERVSVFAIDRSGLSMADAMLEIVPHANLHFLGKCLDQCAYKLLTDMCLMSRCRCS